MSELELRLAWERFIAPLHLPESQEEFDAVLARHAEPQRHYHTIDHVAWVLRHLDGFDHPDIDRSVTSAAAFYHDAIYDPTRDDNEPASAALARQSLNNLGWSDVVVEQVAAVILATADHPIADNVTMSAFCSADLGVLAADPNDYREYASQIRNEYGFLSDDEWQRGRAAVLDALTSRDAIFDGRIVPADWETRARGNIAAELAALNGH